MDVVDYLDLLKNELRNGVIHVLASDPSSPVEGQIYYNSTNHVFTFYNGTAWISLGKLNQISAPAADVSLASHKITSLADGTASSDAINKGQLDAAVTGLSWKASVRVATTGNGTLATAYENTDTVDGVTLATGDRILIKDQTDPKENGIYVVAASGAPARAADANSGAELRQAAVFVEAGTANADTGWVMTFNGTPTIGSDNITFVQFTGSSITAGDGLQLTGSTLDVLTDGVTTEINGSNEVAVISTGLPVDHGGTGATDAETARANLGTPGTYETDIDGTDTVTVTHNLNTDYPIVQVWRVSDGALVIAGVVTNDADSVDVTTTSGGSGAFHVRVIG